MGTGVGKVRKLGVDSHNDFDLCRRECASLQSRHPLVIP